MRRLAFVALTLTTTSVAAQTPADQYRDTLLGHYGWSSICLGQEFVLSLMEDRVNIGETGCRIARVSGSDAGVVLDLQSCQSEGEPSADRSIQVSPTASGGVVWGLPSERSGEVLDACQDIN